MRLTHIILMNFLTGASEGGGASTRRRIRDFGLIRAETVGETGLGDLGEF
jgi:hypothetical protein